MRGDELRIVNAFCAHLEQQGWRVEREVDWVDVVATRGGHTLLAEAKGRTAAVRTDIDTLYGQLLRRMPATDDPTTRYAVVVPTRAEAAVTAIPARIRQLLRIDVYLVDEHGKVTMSPAGPDLSGSSYET